MFYFLVSVFFIKFLFSFSKKLNCLIFLEALTLVLLFICVMYFNQASSIFSGICLILVLMMVLDSVFGLCMLVASSRNDCMISSLYLHV